jgi:phosphoribosylformimino-5-aminoimidazole carboxamide ribotide isomerase
MLLIPAIDLKDGACVRLKQGDMAQTTIFSSDPAHMAQHWLDQGCQRLHLVDLNGAFAGAPQNLSVIQAILEVVQQKIPVQLGGGIRDLPTAEKYLNMGIEYLIVGSAMIKNPSFVMELIREFPKHIIGGVDAKSGYVAIEGWAELTQQTAADLLKPFVEVGMHQVIFTDIAKDGMLSGPNLADTLTLAKSLDVGVFVSGGMSSFDDVKDLYQIAHQNPSHLLGAICGRAIYDSSIDFTIAQQWVNQQKIQNKD